MNPGKCMEAAVQQGENVEYYIPSRAAAIPVSIVPSVRCEHENTVFKKTRYSQIKANLP